MRKGKEQQVIKNEKNFSSKFPNLEIRTYDCSASVRSALQHLFLNYDTLTQPLTAITVVFPTKFDMSTWSQDVENERQRLSEQFMDLAHDIANDLIAKQYWVDFIDPSTGKPYFGPSTSDSLLETDERCQHFGMNIVDLGCCRVIEHLQHGKIPTHLFPNSVHLPLGTHVFVGCIFTSASKMDSNVQHLLREFPVSDHSEPN